MGVAYFNYHISITDIGRIRIKKSGPKPDMGESSGIFNYAANKDYIHTLHEAARTNNISETHLQELGILLFNTLFDKSLQQNFFDFYTEIIQKKGAFLRLELDVDERCLPDVAALPWELMRVPDHTGHGLTWLSTHPRLIFSRRRARENPPDPICLDNGEKLRIALVIAAPSKSDDTKLGKVEYQVIWKMLRDLNALQLISVLLVKDATINTIETKALKDFNPHIFHFIGHARLKDEQLRDKGEIALTDEVRREEAKWIEASRFSEIFNRYKPHIVLLQACESGALSASEAFVGVASQVVEQNIPVVIAMQYKISNAIAQSFALKFYEYLLRGEMVDIAVQEGRRYIHQELTDYKKRDFATPVLFMSVSNGKFLPQGVIDTDTFSTTYFTDAHKFCNKLKRIQNRIEDEFLYFSKERRIGEDRCQEVEKLLKNTQIFIGELYSFLDNPPKNIPRLRLVETAEINHANDILISLLRSLKTFCPQVPPAPYEREMSYYKQRESILSMLNMLLEKLSEIYTFLKEYLAKFSIL